MLTLISMVVSSVVLLVLAVSYFKTLKTLKAIERDDINEAMAYAHRLKNKRGSTPRAGA